MSDASGTVATTSSCSGGYVWEGACADSVRVCWHAGDVVVGKVCCYVSGEE